MQVWMGVVEEMIRWSDVKFDRLRRFMLGARIG
jgi:hypothetical protein